MGGVAFEVVDTGGWLPGGDDLDAKVSEQAARALDGADLVLFVVDVAVGVTEEDLAAARFVQRCGRPALLVANKVDDDTQASARSGSSSPSGSASRSRSAPCTAGAPATSSTRSSRPSTPATTRPADPQAREEGGPLRVAIVGRPNVGKSTLFNALIGDDRAIVHDLPGTTRDAVDTVVDTVDGPICFVDTAGMRRRAKTEAGLETYAVLRSLEALDRADLALLVIDATVRATAQDQRLAERIAAAGCPVGRRPQQVGPHRDRRPHRRPRDRSRTASRSSATPRCSRSPRSSGRGVHRVLPALAASAAEDYHRRIPTGPLNRALRDLQSHHAAPGARVRYVVQGAIDPPTFTLFASAPAPPALPALPRARAPREVRPRLHAAASCACRIG